MDFLIACEGRREDLVLNLASARKKYEEDAK
jgi:hypothetical protein